MKLTMRIRITGTAVRAGRPVVTSFAVTVRYSFHGGEDCPVFNTPCTRTAAEQIAKDPTGGDVRTVRSTATRTA